MGIDWEGILGAEGDDLADAYEAAMPDIDYGSPDINYGSYDDYEKEREKELEKIKAAFTVTLKSGVKITYVDHYNQHYTLVDGYSFYLGNDKSIKDLDVTRLPQAAADIYEFEPSPDIYEFEPSLDIYEPCYPDHDVEKPYISINGFSVKESKLADAPKPSSNFDDIEGIPEFKTVDINEYENFSSELSEKYRTTKIDFKVHEYYDENGKHFIHIIRDTQIIRYDEYYDEEENYGISSFRNEIRFCHYRINDKDVVCFDNNYIARKNGSDEICVNGYEYAHHYDKNGDEIFRYGDYELVVHEEDYKKTGRINGIECDNVIYTEPFPICPTCPKSLAPSKSSVPSKSTDEFDPDELPY